MPNSKQFIEEFGSKTFSEHPFCDADALALTEVFYMPLELVVSASFDDEPVNFSDACNKLFDLRDNKHKPLGLMITSTPSKRLMQMAATARYSELKIANVHEVYSSAPAIQYCAGTFLLPDGTVVVIYRGTDDTIAGWKEDLDIYTKKGTPSYDLALEHLEKVAELFSGDIIVSGHSKGGNIALKTACECSESTRVRIKNVYNFDGPGYSDYSIFYTSAYDEILPGYRHYVPSSSFIGMLMNHDYDYKAVKSSQLLGPMQHDLGSWQIKNGEIQLVEDVDILAKITDEWMASMLKRLGDAGTAALDTVITAITEGTGKKTLTEVAKHSYSAVGGAAKAYKNLPSETKEEFKNDFRGTAKVLLGAIITVLQDTKLAATAVTDSVLRKVASEIL